MSRLLALPLIGIGLIAAAAMPQAAPPPPAAVAGATPPGQTAASLGKLLFQEKCAMCHRTMGMGTGLLARRSDTPLLEARTDLSTELVMEAARTGIGNMPAIPRGEVSDTQMAAIADYLAKTEVAK